jgi:Immunity protein 49
VNWLLGEPLVATRTKIDTQALPNYFEKAMQLAFVCRNIVALNVLSKLPIEKLEAATDSLTPYYLHSMIQAYQTLWNGHTENAIDLSANAYQLIIAQIEELRSRGGKLSWREDFHLSITSYSAELFKLAISPNTSSAVFNSKLTDALWSFRDCILRNDDLYNDWNYYFSFGALAAASIAWDRGLDVNVISDYLPGFLYKDLHATKKLEIPNLLRV